MPSVAQMGPKKVVYVSCNPVTLARDLKYMVKYGYKVEKIQPVDMFLFYDHVETVCLLANRNVKPDIYIKLGLDMEDYYRIKDAEKEKNKTS